MDAIGNSEALCILFFVRREFEHNYNIDRPFFRDVNFTYEQVQKAFDALVDLKLMEKIGTIEGFTRYDFIDDWLAYLVSGFWSDHELLLSEMNDTLHNRKLATMKRKWLEKYLGYDQADVVIRSDYDQVSRISSSDSPNSQFTIESDARDWADLISRRYKELKKMYKEKIDTYEPIPELLFQMADIFQDPISYQQHSRTRRRKTRQRWNWDPASG